MRCFAYLFDTNNHVGGLHDGVDFLPLQDEWLDVALSLEAQQCTEVAEAACRLLRTRAFRGDVAQLVGYDVSRMGQTVFEQ